MTTLTFAAASLAVSALFVANAPRTDALPGGPRELAANQSTSSVLLATATDRRQSDELAGSEQRDELGQQFNESAPGQ